MNLLPPQLRDTTDSTMYLEDTQVFYSPTSKLYNKVIKLITKSFFFGLGTPPNQTPNFKVGWMSLIRKEGLRMYRPVDWDVFWRRVHMGVIKYQVQYMDNKELSPDHDILSANISRLIKGMPQDKDPVLTRGQFFGSHISFGDVAKVRNVLQAMLVYTSKACDDAGVDYPAWFSETESMVKALFNGLYLRKQKVKKYFFTSDGDGEVASIKIQASSDAVLVDGDTLSLEEAKQLAYTIIESVNYVEEKAHVKAKEEEQARRAVL